MDPHECTEGDVEFVGRDGVGVGLHVGAHVENGTIKDKVVFESRYLVPVVAYDVVGVDDVECCKGGGGVDVAKGARSYSATGRVEGHTKVEPSASPEVGSIALEQSRNVLTRLRGKVRKRYVIRRCCRRDVVDKTLDTEGVYGRAQSDKMTTFAARLRTQHLLETDSCETDGTTEDRNEEAQSNLLSPGLSCRLVLQTPE